MSFIWRAEDVLYAVRGQSLQARGWRALGVSIDSRTTQEGDLFIALKGSNFDGHAFVSQAFEAGAVAAIVEKAPADAPYGVPLILVPDSFVALQDLGRARRAQASADVFGVTGSVGKTSTKEMLRLMLESVAPTYANEGSLNNHWGVPLSLARLPMDARFGVFEMGMSHAGEIEELTRAVKPDVALITNVEAVHLEFFGSLNKIADAKSEIFLSMNSNGIAILNRDDNSYARLLAAARTQGLRRILGFGADTRSDARLLSYQRQNGESFVRADVLGQKLTYRLKVAGLHHALNALGALLSAGAVGADLQLCAESLSFYAIPNGRGSEEKITLPSHSSARQEGHSFTLIDESFNASPVATRSAIRALGERVVQGGGERYLVLGDMLELGPKAAEMHAALLQDILDADIGHVFCCGQMMRILFDKLPLQKQGKWCATSDELAPYVALAMHAGDTIVVKGSKSMKMPKIIAALRELGSIAETRQNSDKMAG